jgi:trehalose 6-phosphate synthase
MRAIEAPIVVASNRGPVAFDLDDAGGKLTVQRGTGGLVTALAGVVFESDATWIAAAMTEGDREVALGGREVPESQARMRYLVIPPERYDRYYNQISNRILWFAHHYLWDTVRSPVFDDETEAAWDDFVEVNRDFAVALSEESKRQPVYLVQDYHLSLVPQMLRELEPDAKIAHFSHTPFAGSTYLRVLPKRIHDELLRGMLGADVLGFQSQAWAENFLLSARTVPGAKVDLRRWRVTIGGRHVLVHAYPISVDVGSLRETSATAETRAMRREIRRWRGDAKMLLRVDRLELSKNIARGFTAFELFLRQNPDWRGRVKFLALLSPSRMEIPEYQEYTEECLAEAERVNEELGEDGWTPIEVRVQESYPQAVAAYALYDAMLVNPVFDGMNLVAMEGPLVNRRHGALILSRNAGAYGRLGRHAIGINPFDVNETAIGIKTALEMPEDERWRHARGLARAVLGNTPARWLTHQLEDLDRAHPGSNGSNAPS